MVQQSRTIQGMLVLWGLSLALVIAGCGGGEDTSTPLTQQIPPNVASPQDLHMKGFRFSTGEPFHIDSTGQGDVLLFFGDFQGTNAAPFTLVAGGFRATGTATKLNIYTLSVQESTFPAASSTQGALGPQVGDQLLITINLSTTPPQAQEVRALVDANGVRDFTRLMLIGHPIPVRRTCETKKGEDDPVQLELLVPAGVEASGGCITVNGTINFQEAFFTDTWNLDVQSANQIIQFILTFPVSTADDLRDIDFNLTIRRKDNPNITNNTDILQSCVSTSIGQEACSIVLQQTDFAGAPFLPLQITVEAKSQFVTLGDDRRRYTTGTGNYTLEIVSTLSLEVEDRKTICPVTGPSTIPEQEPNGKSVRNPDPSLGFLTDTQTSVFQDVGTLSLVNGCLPIRGHMGASIIRRIEADGFDKYRFSVEDAVETVAFLLNPTNLTENAFGLIIDEFIPPTTPGGTFSVNRITECDTTGASTLPDEVPGTSVTCSVSVPPSRNLRVGVNSYRVCPVPSREGCRVESDYSLDIIAVAQSNILVKSTPCTEPTSGIIVPVCR